MSLFYELSFYYTFTYDKTKKKKTIINMNKKNNLAITPETK